MLAETHTSLVVPARGKGALDGSQVIVVGSIPATDFPSVNAMQPFVHQEWLIRERGVQGQVRGKT